jgi:hypothetical protein
MAVLIPAGRSTVTCSGAEGARHPGRLRDANFVPRPSPELLELGPELSRRSGLDDRCAGS